jgi:hypothetical protein
MLGDGNPPTDLRGAFVSQGQDESFCGNILYATGKIISQDNCISQKSFVPKTCSWFRDPQEVCMFTASPTRLIHINLRCPAVYPVPPARRYTRIPVIPLIDPIEITRSVFSNACGVFIVISASPYFVNASLGTMCVSVD